MPPRMPVYVISLRRSQDRRQLILPRLEALGIRCEVVDAADGALLRTEETLEELRALAPEATAGFRAANPEPLAPAELACMLSHARCWARIRDEGHDSACILEDDALPNATFPRLLDAPLVRENWWDILLLGHMSYPRRNPARGAEHTYRTVTRGEFRFAVPVRMPLLTVGYVLRGQTPQRLLDFAAPPRFPVDWITGNAPACGLRLFLAVPPCVLPDPAVPGGTTVTDRKAGPPDDPATIEPLPPLRRARLFLKLLPSKLGILPTLYARSKRKPAL